MDWREARISANVGPGWEALVDELHAKVLELDPDATVVQVKEKFGGLRYYLMRDTNLDQLVRDYEQRSLGVCEWCGATEGVTTAPNARGWLKTLCPTHRAAWDREERWW